MRAITNFCIAFVFATFNAAVASGPTPEQLAHAEQIRAMGIKMGLDKQDPAAILMVAKTISAGSKKRDMTKDEEAALICVAGKMQAFQYKGPLADYAMFLADKTYAAKIEQEIGTACGMDRFVKK